MVYHSPLYPPYYGDLRVYHLAKNLAQMFDVRVLTLSRPLLSHYRDTSVDSLLISNIPQVSVLPGALFSKVSGIQVGQVITSFLASLAFKFKRILKENILSSDITIVEYPWLFPLVAQYKDNKPVIYSSHDVNVFLKRDIYARWPLVSKIVMPRIANLEKIACRQSILTVATCEDDKDQLSSLYGVPADRIYVAPNGVDTADIVFPEDCDKEEAKQRLGWQGEKVAIFIGGAHPPNAEAARFIISRIAPDVANCKFVLVGRLGSGVGKVTGENVQMLGLVDESTKKIMLAAADIALNPMFHGGGTNLKMLEYLAAGLPVISTPFGARGLAVEDGKHIMVAQVEEFTFKVQALLADNGLCKRLRENGRRLVEEVYDWQMIAKGLGRKYMELLRKNE
jgi:glycosyltransferase involved in cell wall biosynthesis